MSDTGAAARFFAFSFFIFSLFLHFFRDHSTRPVIHALLFFFDRFLFISDSAPVIFEPTPGGLLDIIIFRCLFFDASLMLVK